MADQNLSAMSDEELDKAIEEAGIDPAPAPSPEVEEPETPETPEEEVETPEEEPEEEEVPEPKPEPKEPSRREQKRVSDLLKKYPELEKEQPAKPAKQQSSHENPFDYDTDLEADEGLKQRLKADRDAAIKAAREAGIAEGQSSFAQERARILFQTRIDIDEPRVEAKYPILDKNSEKFNPQLANDVNTLFLQAAQFNPQTKTVGNPDVRYEAFVEAFFTAAKEAAGEMVAETTKNVRKRAANTGLRPDGSAPSKKLNLNKLPHQMTDEELDAAIAQGLPSN